MTGFDDREKAFEAKFKQDQELRFKVTVRRNKLLGLWAAELMGLGADEAEAYAQEVVKSDFEAPGDADVHDKVMEDMTAKGVDTSDHRLRKKMDALLTEAAEQLRDQI